MREQQFRCLEEVRRIYFPNTVRSELTVEEAAQECVERLLADFKRNLVLRAGGCDHR